jgi:uncharacterized protein (TIGR00645 family)
MSDVKPTEAKRKFGSLFFMSRWLQAPLYIGLIVAQGIYVYRFMVELWHLVGMAIANKNADGLPITEADVMLVVLGLVDVVMVANLLIMVIVGGYETFVSRLYLENHADEPEWLSHVNAGMLKVKLAMALIGISSIHLLKTFISVEKSTSTAIMWQVLIHLTFVVSAFMLAWTDRVVTPKPMQH